MPSPPWTLTTRLQGRSLRARTVHQSLLGRHWGRKVATEKVRNGPEAFNVPKPMTSSKGKRPKENVHAPSESTTQPEKKSTPITNNPEKPRQEKTGSPIKKSDDAVRTKSLTPLEKRFASETKTTNIGADMLANSRNDVDNPVPKESVASHNSDKVAGESTTPWGK